MGCWTEICGITGLSIKRNTPVVGVYFSKDILVTRPYNNFGINKQDKDSIEKFVHLNSQVSFAYNGLKGLYYTPEYEFLKIEKGVYDDYGRVEGFKVDREIIETIFVIEEIWNKVLQKYNSKIDSSFEEYVDILCKYQEYRYDDILEWHNVSTFLTHARINFFAPIFRRGLYEGNHNEQKWLAELTLDYLNKLPKEEEEEEDEDDE